MKALVLGGGSAGQRHARLLAARGVDVSLTDPNPLRCAAPEGVRIVPFDDDVITRFAAVVIASPSSVHEAQAIRCLDAGAKVMVEKPMALDEAGARRVCERGSERVMVAYNLRVHPPVERFMELTRNGTAGRILSARLWFGSYLPSWRPRTDYRQTYSAQAELGGGVLLDAIHELDLAIWLLGRDIMVKGSLVRRVSDLEIDVEDIVTAVAEAGTGTILTLSLDYLSRRYRRGMEVVGTLATIRLDWATGDITVEREDDVQRESAATPVSHSYERQADRFVSWLEDGVAPPVDGEEGVASVRLADQIRAAG